MSKTVWHTFLSALIALLFWPPMQAISDNAAPTADLTGDSVVNLDDFFLLAEQFGTTGDDLLADLTGDGVVNLDDFFLLAEQFGTTAASLLKPIGDQEAPLGSVFTLQLEAADSATRLSRFWAAPLPLPENASFDAATGLFNFTPSAAQAGESFTILFAASDGALNDCRTVTISVPTPDAAVTRFIGRVLDANDAAQGNQTPIVGAVVSLLGTGLQAASGADGRFVLLDSSGTDLSDAVLDIATDAAGPAPDGSRYAGFRERLPLIANADNIVERPFYLPRIAGGSVALVDPGQTTMLENSDLGMTVEIAAFSARNEDGELYAGELSVSEVPKDLAPAALPANLDFGLLVTIQPLGVTFDPPAAITFPNVDGLAPGNEADIWSLDPESGLFTVVGTGRVSTDGSVIETISGGVRRTDWHGSSQGVVAMAPVLGGDIEPSLRNGNTSVTRSLCEDIPFSGDSGIREFAQRTADSPQTKSAPGLELVYNSHYARPRPIVALETTIPRRFAVPPQVSLRGSIGGIEQDFEVFTATDGLDEDRDETIRQRAQFDATELPTGIYPYTVTLTSHYSRSSVSSSASGRLLVNNLSDSPFGAGWNLKGLARLYPQKNGDVLLVEDDGRPKLFTRASLGSGRFAEQTRFASGGALTRDTRVADLDNDGLADLVLVNHDSDDLGLLLGDGAGGFAAPRLFETGNAPFAGVTVDLNGDGRVDLATANETSDDVSVLLGRGAGDFADAVSWPVGDRPRAVEAGDFNGDRQADLIVTNDADNSLQLLAGDGLGGFVTGQPLQLERAGFAEAADFDNDGVLDLAVGNWPDSGLYILKGNGDGTFADPVEFATGLAVTAAEAADFDGDGFQDLASANFNGDDITVLLNDGDGGMREGTNYPTGDGTRDLIAGDFNVDGIADLAVSNQNARTVSTLLGDGDGFFAAAIEAEAGAAPRSLVQADFNGDRIPDLAVGNSGEASILLGEPSEEEGLVAPEGDPSVMVQEEDGTYVLRTPLGGSDDLALGHAQLLSEGEELARFFTESGLLDARFVGNSLSVDYTLDEAGVVNEASTFTAEDFKFFYTDDASGEVRVDCPDERSVLLDLEEGNLIAIRDPDTDGGGCSYQYDENGHLIEETCDGETATYTYDDNGLNTFVRAADGSQISILSGAAEGEGTREDPLPASRPEEEVGAVYRSSVDLRLTLDNTYRVWSSDLTPPVELTFSGAVETSDPDALQVGVNGQSVTLDLDPSPGPDVGTLGPRRTLFSWVFVDEMRELDADERLRYGFQETGCLASGVVCGGASVTFNLPGGETEHLYPVEVRQDTPPVIESLTPVEGSEILIAELGGPIRAVTVEATIIDNEGNLTEVFANDVPVPFRDLSQMDGTNVEGVFFDDRPEGAWRLYPVVVQVSVSDNVPFVSLRAISASGLESIITTNVPSIELD